MRISEISAQTGLSVDTIRFYEKSGICPPIHRGADGKRQFSAENVAWLTLLASLRETGMPLKEMTRFAGLYQMGNATVPERRAILQTHAASLHERQRALERCEALLNTKIARYDDIMGGAR